MDKKLNMIVYLIAKVPKSYTASNTPMFKAMFKIGLVHTPSHGYVHIPSINFGLSKSYTTSHMPVCVTMFLSDLLFS